MNLLKQTNMKYILKILFIFLLVTLELNVLSQENSPKTKSSFFERVYIGGALGVSFGTYSTLIDVSPMFGYALTNDLIVGIGLSYKYYRYKDYYLNMDNGKLEDYKTHMYGGSIYSRYFLTSIGIPIIENMFLHAELEPLVFRNEYRYSPYGKYYDPYGNKYTKETDQINITSYFLGGGLRQLLGARSYMYIEVLWNFNEELYTPYSNPRVRIGFAAGF